MDEVKPFSESISTGAKNNQDQDSIINFDSKNSSHILKLERAWQEINAWKMNNKGTLSKDSRLTIQQFFGCSAEELIGTIDEFGFFDFLKNIPIIGRLFGKKDKKKTARAEDGSLIKNPDEYWQLKTSVGMIEKTGASLAEIDAAAKKRAAGQTLSKREAEILSKIDQLQKKSESNVIPQGENYHRDVGWY